MPRTRPPTSRSAVEVALACLGGAPPTEAEAAQLRRAAGEAGPKGSRAAGKGPTETPTLPPPFQGPNAARVGRMLALWALLATGRASEPKMAALVAREVADHWAAPPTPVEGTDGATRLLSIPLVLLDPRGPREVPLPAEPPLTWKQATARCMAWFEEHLRRAQGHDALANWVLVRLPRVWMIPERREGPHGAEGGPSLADEADRFLPPREGELQGRPRRRPPRPGAGATG